ncbi:EAL domain-containing protein [Granulosicoccus antarcticus]|uniref:Putative signaling protein n=1 Tax=Granulosicoccus antarcticus IMCC3135 TaxID=1192854 RepID=A0A2Z2P740_9GAMM|nr:EAL domain-containing protein [Granulosicoccus antarcticus]ASJ76507.1 putative signaling protein [Granulosicoccus antarcticus IMCC3135]
MSRQVTREALEQAMRNDELVLFYQPKVCLLTGDVLGAEALVRWTDNSNVVLSPDEFLPLVESSGLLHDLTLQLLDQLVAAIVTLRDTAPAATQAGAVAHLPGALENRRSLALSINVAPDDLASRTISNQIHALLQAGTISAPELQIEITESAVMGNVDRVYDDLVRLKNMGIKILMDDFGTGYSSIDRLSQLPFDSLKLDQGVVKRMATSRQNLDVVRSAISMARELGMTSVAEGIETESVYNFLIAHGCEEGQGYFLGRPMSLHDFKGFVCAEHDFEGSQIGRVHQASLNLLRFRKALLDAAFCSRFGGGVALQSVADPGMQPDVALSRLGVWYFGIGQRLAGFEAFREIEQPLRLVHASGLEFLQQLEQGKSTGTLDQHLADFDSQIDRLVSLLHTLERAILTRKSQGSSPNPQ